MFLPAQFWVFAVLSIPVGFIALGLVLFFFIQVYDTWTKDGMIPALALAFTSIIIFPIATILEAIENLVFPPLGFPHATDGEGGGGGGGKKRVFILGGGQFAHLDGVVYHLRMEQATNDFKYRVSYALVPLDRPPASFTPGYDQP